MIPNEVKTKRSQQPNEAKTQNVRSNEERNEEQIVYDIIQKYIIQSFPADSLELSDRNKY